MKSITREEFAAVEKSNPYYRGRWSYIETAIALVKACLPQTVIEVGPGWTRLFPGSTALDVKGAPHFLEHDVGIAPWPTEPHDVVIGLQVWEHLGPHSGERQRYAFQEALNHARLGIVLSFPLEWNCPSDPTHHGITRAMIRHWTLDKEPTAEVLVRNRLVCLWRPFFGTTR